MIKGLLMNIINYDDYYNDYLIYLYLKWFYFKKYNKHINIPINHLSRDNYQ